MVPLTATSSVSELHNSVHALALNARDDDNWWNGSLENGIAAAAGALHPKGTNRRIGELALAGLLRWYDGGDARNVSDDAAALALGAFAAEELHGGNKRLTRAAVTTLTAVLSNTNQGPVAPIHLALSAWALRQVMSVDDDSPWSELRERLPEMPVAGLDGLLVRYTQQLAKKHADPRALAQVLQDVPAVAPSEYPMLLWALWSGSLVLAQQLPVDDHDLMVVRQRRADIFEAIAASTGGGEGFLTEVVDDYDPFPETVEQPQREPDTFNVLMVDLALSTEMSAEPLPSAAEFSIALEQRNRPWIYAVAAGIEVVAVVGTGLAVTASLLANAREQIILGIAALIFAVLTLIAFKVLARASRPTRTRSALTDAVIAMGIGGIAIIVNWRGTKPVLSASHFWTFFVELGGPIAILTASVAVRSWTER